MKLFKSPHRLAPISSVPREGTQSNQVISELLRSLLSRAEDAFTLRSLSDPRTNKAKFTSQIAEKAIAEIEAKEEWRLTREENLLNTISGLRFENAIERK